MIVYILLRQEPAEGGHDMSNILVLKNLQHF